MAALLADMGFHCQHLSGQMKVSTRPEQSSPLDLLEHPNSRLFFHRPMTSWAWPAAVKRLYELVCHADLKVMCAQKLVRKAISSLIDCPKCSSDVGVESQAVGFEFRAACMDLPFRPFQCMD